MIESLTNSNLKQIHYYTASKDISHPIEG